MVKKFHLIFMLLFITALFSCKKDEDPVVVDPGTEYNNDLDWETTTSLSFSYGGQSYDISMFNNNVVASTYATESALKDVRKVDGWRLVYNWFIPSEWGRQTEFPMMLFYNVYRGKFKLCYYHIGPNTTNGKILFSLAAVDDGTSIFNMNDILSEPQAKAYSNSVSESCESNFASSSVGLNNATWYVFEWDASYYDPDLNPGERMALAGHSIQTSNVNLNGTIFGDINGKLVSTSKTKNGIIDQSDISSAITGGTKTILTSIGKKKVAPFFQKLSDKSSGVIKTLFGKLASDATITNIAGTLAGPIGGIIGKGVSFLLGKIFPGKETTEEKEQSVELKVSLKQTLNGVITTDNPVRTLKFEIPTQKLSENSYFGKYGLFRLTAKPSVGVYEECYSTSNASGPINVIQLLAVIEQNNIEVNPDLLEVADVTHSARLVYVQNPNDTKIPAQMYDYDLCGFLLDSESDTGHKRIIPSDNIIYTYILTNFDPANPTMLPSEQLPLYTPYQNIKILVNFKITPKNGSDPVLVNQLFEPEYVGHTIYNLSAN